MIKTIKLPDDFFPLVKNTTAKVLIDTDGDILEIVLDTGQTEIELDSSYWSSELINLIREGKNV